MSWEWLMGAPYPVRERGIVNLKNGSAFRGVIWQRKDGFLLLKGAEMLKPRGEAVPIDGEVLLYETDVEFIQIPNARGE